MPTITPETTPKLGYKWKVYYCLAGIGDTPTWVEWPELGNVEFPIAFGEAENTVRQSNGWETSDAALLKASIEASFPYVAQNVNYEAIMTAAMARSNIGIAFMDGPIAPGSGITSTGFWIDMKVVGAPISADMTKDSEVKMTLRPAWSANAPQRKIITGS